jgi:hypothetical protein
VQKADHKEGEAGGAVRREGRAVAAVVKPAAVAEAAVRAADNSVINASLLCSGGSDVGSHGRNTPVLASTEKAPRAWFGERGGPRRGPLTIASSLLCGAPSAAVAAVMLAAMAEAC